MRTIDADALTEDVVKLAKTGRTTNYDTANFNLGYNTALLHVKNLIQSAPTIDAEPVRHGEWLADIYNLETYETKTVPYDGWHGDAYCSECGNYALLNSHEEDVDSKYCPECGAKMDGGRANDEAD